MTEREWFAIQDPLVLLAFVQEHSGVALLKDSPHPPSERKGWRVGELYRSPIEPRWEVEAELVRRLHRYLLACCRNIWPLLPQEKSRRGVEIAEEYIAGQATDSDFYRADWDAEGAAYFLEYHDDDPDLPPTFREVYSGLNRMDTVRSSPEEQERWRAYEADRREQITQMTRDVAGIPAREIRRMVRAVPTRDPLTPRHLLYLAAYFADTAIAYPGISPRPGLIERDPYFLSADLLRRHVRYPLHAQTPGPGHVWWARYGTKA